MLNKNELLQKYLDLVRYAPRLRFGSNQYEWISSSQYEIEHTLSGGDKKINQLRRSVE